MAAPTVVNSGSVSNGASTPNDHSRKPSVTITSSGATGSLANGGPPTDRSSRPNINFGSINVGDPSSLSQGPGMINPGSQLPPPQQNPRVTSPAVSPSPIPTPNRSGGQPPANLSAQNNGLNFFSQPSDGEPRAPMRNASSGSMVGGQPSHQPSHLRRESSQSGQNDMGNPAVPFNQGMAGAGSNRGGYMGGAGRGGRAFNQYNQQMPYSPSPNYGRPMPTQSRPPMPPHFGGQPAMGAYPTNSPHTAPRSPAMTGSHPATPQMQHMPMAPNSQMQFPPQYMSYQQQLAASQSNQFQIQPPYDPNYGYWQANYPGHQQYIQGMPSPRYSQRTPSSHNQYMPAPYNQPHSQSMSRTNSQVSERPPSTFDQNNQQPPPPPSSTPGVSVTSHAPSQSVGGTSAPASQANKFQIPSKAKSAITIKNDAGEVVTFDKQKPASGGVQSSAPSSTAPTPPPRSSSTASHTRAESKSTKTAAEIQAEFREQVKRGQEGEKRIKEEETPKLELPDEDTAAGPTSSGARTPELEVPVSEKEEVPSPQAEEPATAPEVPEALEAAKVEEAKEEPPKEAEPAVEETEEQKKKREEDEEIERMIAEMEAKDREEEEKEKMFAEKRKKEAEEKAALEKEKAANLDEELKRQEREAEEAEERREKERAEKREQDEETEQSRQEKLDMFAALKKSDLGPGASTPSGAETPVSDDSASAPSAAAKAAPSPSPQPAQPQRAASGTKPKPLPLTLNTKQPVEPAQPTAGMQSLKSARLLSLRDEAVTYPEGIKSPNPALIQGSRRKGAVYDKDFLLQFQEVFKEKPSLDWDDKLKQTLGDAEPTPKSARPSTSGLGGRASSARGGPPQNQFPPGGMGNLGAGARLSNVRPPSQAKFDGSGRGPMGAGVGVAGRPGGMGMGNFGMPPGQLPQMPGMAPSPRQVSQRGKNDSRRGNERMPSRKEVEASNKAMPLTAGGQVKALEVSNSGWKPNSLTNTRPNQPGPDGHMAPDVVQRKVNAALNKMTPEKFEKISDQILEIAHQSKQETDGRTLRQVIALIFDKACDEAHWSSMYAKFCLRMLETMSSEIQDEGIKDKNGNPTTGGALFRKYLLNRCQEEFERGWEVNLPDTQESKKENGEAVMLSDEYYVAAKAKRRGLGLIQFIGELFKLRMLSFKIMHECFKKLLDFDGLPEESTVESLVKLLWTVGPTMESMENGSNFMAAYFERVDKIMKMENLPSRMYFMLLDTVDLRKANWQSKTGDKGPKTITEIRNEALAQQEAAEAERARQNQRGGGRMPSGRGDARAVSGGLQPPQDYNRNQIGTDDLRKLGQRASSRQTSQGGRSGFGPPTNFASRSGSGRQGFGPPSALSRGDGSGSGTRTPSQAVDKEDEAPKSANAFSALEALDATGEATPASSPRTSKAQPAISTEAPASGAGADSAPTTKEESA